LSNLLPDEIENVEVPDGAVRKEAVDRILFVEEDIEQDLQCCRYQEIHLRSRHVQQDNPASRPSEP
jgi:hypothetical protein